VRRRRFWPIYLAILTVISVAAGFLGYSTYVTISEKAALGNQSILQSTLLLVREKVDQFEQQIIRSDQAVFQLINLDTPELFADRFMSLASEISPSVSDVLILEPNGHPVIEVSRQSPR